MRAVSIQREWFIKRRIDGLITFTQSLIRRWTRASDVDEQFAWFCFGQLHGAMCNKLAVLVSNLAKPLPALNAERHRWQKSGVQAFCSLQMALEKSRALLQYCAHSSKLYLVRLFSSLCFLLRSPS